MQEPTVITYSVQKNIAKVYEFRNNLCAILNIKWKQEHKNTIPKENFEFCPYIALPWFAESIRMNTFVILGDLGENKTPYHSYIIDVNLPFIILDWKTNHIQPVFQFEPMIGSVADTGLGVSLAGKKFSWSFNEIKHLLTGNQFFNITTSHPNPEIQYLTESSNSIKEVGNFVVSILMV